MGFHQNTLPGTILCLRISIVPVCFSFLLLAVFSGCITVGPDYEKPEPQVPDAWNEALMEDFTSGEPDMQQWWTLFGDPTLDEIIAKVGEGNLTLKIAMARIEEARALRGLSASAYYPQLGADGSITATRASSETSPFLPEDLDRENTVYSVGATLGWELDVFGRVRRSVESADASIQAAEESYRDLLVLLYADVSANYIQLRALQERIRIAVDNATAQADTLKLTQDRLSAGLVGELDVRQAELSLAKTRSSIPVLQRGVAQVLHRLAVLIGQAPSSLNALMGTAASSPMPPKDIAVGVPADLLRQRPDVRQAERELASQHARIGVAKAEFYPIFALPGTFSLEAFDIGNLGGEALTYGFGPAFRWNIFSGGRVRSQVQVEESRTRQALQKYEQTVLLALEDVENAMVAMERERERQVDLAAAALAASESVKLVKTLYTSGLTDFQNVLNMEQSLLEAQDALASSHGELSTFATQLYKALGGGWALNPIPAAATAEVPADETEQP